MRVVVFVVVAGVEKQPETKLNTKVSRRRSRDGSTDLCFLLVAFWQTNALEGLKSLSSSISTRFESLVFGVGVFPEKTLRVVVDQRSISG